MNQSISPLLNASDLTQMYADKKAVDGLSLSLHRGEVLGLLGLNGAGKSSTLRILAGVLTPSSGHIEIDGVSLISYPRKAKRLLGYLPEVAPLYTDMIVIDYLRYAGRLRGLQGEKLKRACDALMQRLQLTEVSKRRIGKLSKGFKQRVGLAQALVHDPQLLILDEPSSGLDPEQMREMRDMIRSLAHDKAIIFSSHLLSEVKAVCDRVVVLHQGKQVYTGKLDDQAASTGRFIVKFNSELDVTDLLSIQGIAAAESIQDKTWAITPADSLHGQLLPRLVAANCAIVEFAPERPSLETLFSALTNDDLADTRVTQSA